MQELAFVGAHWAPIVGQGLGFGPEFRTQPAGFGEDCLCSFNQGE
jgi:hypothetical protein